VKRTTAFYFSGRLLSYYSSFCFSFHRCFGHFWSAPSLFWCLLWCAVCGVIFVVWGNRTCCDTNSGMYCICGVVAALV
jgi:hypothetical protein